MTSNTPRARWLGYAACAAAGCLWGTGFFFGKLALREMSVGHMVLYRFLFACLGTLPMGFIARKDIQSRQRPRWTTRDRIILLVSAMLGIPLQFLLQFQGLARTTVSHASLMVGTLPVILALAATLFAGEHMDRLSWLALFGSTLGASLIVLGGQSGSSSGGPTLQGDLLVVLSLTISVGWILMNKTLIHTHGPMAVTAYSILSGTFMLAIWVFATDGPPPVFGVSRTAWIALACSGILCTAATTLLWNWGMHRVPASRAGVFLNIEPALGSVLGVELLGDHLGPLAWLGGAFILTAAVTMTVRNHDFDTEVLLE
jgi:drug/metabolite transporter (DMT)-like permease